ncbi:MAG: hypothetical protein D9V45_12915 [Chloroflexi bacterium]|nr:MAG: hypothetical protein D9V45_12915 [Chloroflexota bacterium]
MAKARKPRTSTGSPFPSDIPVPVNSGDYWKFTQKIVTHNGITGWDAPSHEPHSDEARAKVIRELPAAELEAFCTPPELTSERSYRWLFEQMNQPELEKQAAYDPWAAVELARRNETMPR